MTSSLKKVVCGTALTLVSSFCFAQNTVGDMVSSLTPKPMPKSPEVAALGRFGDYSVNLYTGLPEISIPLYEVRSGSLTLPVTLSYHASGVRYTQQATWVGLGWSLSAGGTLSREIKGKKDEDGFLATPLAALDPCYDYHRVKNAVNGAIDLEADIYSFSFPGKSGKFYRRANSSGIENIFIPYDPIKLTIANNSQFLLKNTDGNLYRFGKNYAGVTSSEFTTGSVQAVTAWNLMDILSMDCKDSININYQSIGFAAGNDLSWNQSVTDQCKTWGLGVECIASVGAAAYSYSNTSTTQSVVSSIFFKGGKIEFVTSAANARLDQPQSKFLDQIVVYALVKNVYTAVKYIKFNYSYFKNSTGTQNLRLKLDGIDVKDLNQKSIQKYRFAYFTDTFSWDQPQYSSQRDYWDYYNGATGNSNLIPVQTIQYQELVDGPITNITVGGAVNRETNPLYAKEGVLKTITFPTGGYSEFDFENHRYFEDGAEKQSGGLRVTTIVSNDSRGGTIKKTFKYGLNECGYGQKNFQYNIYHFFNQSLVRNAIDPELFRTVESRVRTFFSNPAVGGEGGEGSPVVYNYVTEYYGDTGQNIGKIVYEYDKGIFSPDAIQVLPMSNRGYKNTMAWSRGKLTSKSTYDAQGNLLVLNETDYQSFQVSSGLVGIGSAKRLLYPGVYGSNFFLQSCIERFGETIDGMEYVTTGYTQSTGAVLPIQTREKVFEAGNVSRFIESVNIYLRDPVFLEVVESQQNSSEAVTMVSKTKYPFSYTYTGNETGTAKAMRILNERNALGFPIEQLTIVQDTDGTNARVLGGVVTECIESPSNAKQIVPNKYYFIETASPISIGSFTESAINGSNLTKDLAYRERLTNKFDQYGNLIQISKMDDNDVCYLWGYSNHLPIAEVAGTAARNVFYTSFEEITSSFSTNAKTGLQSKTGGFAQTLNGIDNGQYLLSYFTFNGSAWVHTLSEHTVSSGSFNISLSGTIDEVRFYPKGTLMKTYTYRIPFGPSCVSDEHSLTTYYLYDDFGRLMAVKDDQGNLLKTHQYNYVNVD